MRRNIFSRILLLMAGILMLGLGVLGVLLPLLPGTPFLLLAGACLLRSSPRLHHWLWYNRCFGGYLRRLSGVRAAGLKCKLVLLLLFWAMLAISAFVVLPRTAAGALWTRWLLPGLGIAGSLVILLPKNTRAMRSSGNIRTPAFPDPDLGTDPDKGPEI